MISICTRHMDPLTADLLLQDLKGGQETLKNACLYNDSKTIRFQQTKFVKVLKREWIIADTLAER